VELGKPVPLPLDTPREGLATLPAAWPSPQVTTTPTPFPAPTPPIEPYTPPGVGLALGSSGIQQVGAEERFDTPRRVVRGQIEDGAIQPVRLDGPPPVPPPTNAPVVPYLPEGNYNSGVELSRPLHKSFGDQCAEYLGFSTGGDCGGRSWFMSDHAFDEGIISPVTSPFLFEDPRSLTEVRPLWVYTSIPKNSALLGGSTNFLGIQARVAFTENFSLVINKLGGMWFDPKNPNFAFASDGSGFAEFNIGPKWTFLRAEGLGMVAATGLTFQLPIGSGSAFQDTGTFSLDPYLSYGWNFGRTTWGSFNYLTTTGYCVGVDDARSDYFHWHNHLSYDVANLHRIYPLIETSWFKYTHRGNAQPFSFEGKDLFNFGSNNAGLHSYFTIAAGARFKVNEHIQTGIAAEWNLTNNANAIDEFRLTFDLIFRY